MIINETEDPDQIMPSPQLELGDSLGKEPSFTDLNKNSASLPAPAVRWSPDGSPLQDTKPEAMKLAGDSAQGSALVFDDRAQSQASSSPALESSADLSGTNPVDAATDLSFVPGIQASRPGIYREEAPPVHAPAARFDQPGPSDATWQGWDGPHADEDRAAYDQHIGQAFVDDGFRQHLADNPIIGEMVAAGGDQEALSKESVDRAWINNLMGYQTTEAEYQAARDLIGKYVRGKDRTNDDELFQIGRELYTKKFSHDSAVKQLSGLTLEQLLQDTLSGRTSSNAPLVEDWAKQHLDVIDPGSTSSYLAGAKAYADQVRTDLGPLIGPTALTADALDKYSKNQIGSDDLVQLGKMLTSLTPEQRQKIYQYSVAIAEDRHTDPGAVSQFFSNVGREIGGSFGYLDNGPLAGQEAEIEGAVKYLQTGQDAYLSPFARAEMARTEAGQHVLAGDATPEQKQEVTAQFQRYAGSFQVVRELKDIYQNKYAPVRMIAPEYSLWSPAEKGAYGLAGSTGYLVATAIDPVVGAAAIAGDEYQRLLTQNPQMDHDAARLLALVSGSAQAATNAFQLKILAGHSPGLATLLKNLAPGVRKYATTFATSAVDANVGQAAGELVPIAIDQIAQAAGGEHRDLRAVLNQWAEARPAAFFQLLPFAFLGTGLVGLRDLKDRGQAAFTPENMTRAGFSPDAQTWVNAAANPVEKLRRYRQAFEQRTPDTITLGLQQTDQTLNQAQATQADPSRPTLASTTQPDGARVWSVSGPDGSTLQTKDLHTALVHQQEIQKQQAEANGSPQGETAEPPVPPNSSNPSKDSAPTDEDTSGANSPAGDTPKPGPMFSQSEPVAQVSSKDIPRFPKLTPLIDWVGNYFQEKFGGKVTRPDLGDIIIDRRGAKNSVSHGMSATKASAFLSVPDVIKSGEILHTSADRDGKPIENIFIAAPVTIDGESYVTAVRLRRDDKGSRFYVHEVQTTKELQNPSKPGLQSSDRGGFGAVWRVLQDRANSKTQSDGSSGQNTLDSHPSNGFLGENDPLHKSDGSDKMSFDEKADQGQNHDDLGSEPDGGNDVSADLAGRARSAVEKGSLEAGKLGITVKKTNGEQGAAYGADGEITIYLNPKSILSAEKKGLTAGISSGQYAELLVGEEVAHAAHLYLLREQWLSQGKPEGNFVTYVRNYLGDLADNVRASIEQGTPKEQQQLRQALADSYNLYMVEPNVKNPHETADTILSTMRDSYDGSARLMSEFIRQIVQLRRQGKIRESFASRVISVCATWVKKALSGIKKTPAWVEEGRFGEGLRKEVNGLEKMLQGLDENPNQK